MTFWVAILIALVGCQAQPEVSPEVHPTLPPPEGHQSYDACAYLLHYPPELELQVLPSEDVVLFSPSEEAVRFTFSARELEEDEYQSTDSSLLEDLVEQIDVNVPWAFAPVFIVDAEGTKLEGLQADGVSNGLHWRLFAVIHPAVYFWDTTPTIVAYTMHAQVPEDVWEDWHPEMDAIVKTFMPIDCGPY